MSTTLYFVPNWNQTYENNRSRLVKELAWVPVPNGHDGESYGRLISRKDAAVVFSAWILILQVASRCHERGTLLRGNGQPHDSESLAFRTRAPAEWFSKSIPVLIEIGWLSHKQVAGKELALDWQDTAPSSKGSDTEGKGIEQKELKGREGKAAAPPTREDVDSIYKAYPRKEAPADAKKAITKALLSIPTADLLAKTQTYANATREWSDHDRQFIPHPATWFNRGSYDDDPVTWQRKSTNPHHTPAPTAADHLKDRW